MGSIKSKEDAEKLLNDARAQAQLLKQENNAHRLALAADRAESRKLMEQARQQVEASRLILDQLEQRYQHVPVPPVELVNINGNLVPLHSIVTAVITDSGGGFHVCLVLKNGQRHLITRNMVSEAGALSWIERIHKIISTREQAQAKRSESFAPPQATSSSSSSSSEFVPVTKTPGGPPAYTSDLT